MSLRRVVLVTCGSKKLDRPAEARELYVGPFFRACMGYAEKLGPDEIFILSAKHGLLELDRVTAPYDVTLNRMRVEERRAWGHRILGQLKSMYHTGKTQFLILAGENYWKYFACELEHVELPLKGMPIGKARQFLKSACR